MRLLNTKTLKLEYFIANIPPYAILSHTWGKTEDEVTFQDMIMDDDSAVKAKKGYKKIQGACSYALQYNFDWIWIDSCCINKESSAELSEAINSMYSYYEDAEVCYVYLEEADYLEDIRDDESKFRSCRWFTRGWTLQELLAPLYVVFLDGNWNMIGTRYGLSDVISVITSIPEPIFKHGNFDTYSVAQKMSWASLRVTTRPEDRAYSLLGIFGVSMPPIYGEGGQRAFMRLQQEIINISDDRSIFAWVGPFQNARDINDIGEADFDGKHYVRGLLARSPYEFRMSGEVETSKSDLIGDSSFSFGNNGLRIHLPLVPAEQPPPNPRNDKLVRALTTWFKPPAPESIHEKTYPADTIFFAPLHCNSARDSSDGFAVYLKKVAGGRYVRCSPNQLAIIPSGVVPNNVHQIVVKENPGVPRTVKHDRFLTRLNIRIDDERVENITDEQNPLSKLAIIKDKGEEQRGADTSVEIIRRPNPTGTTQAIAKLKYRFRESLETFFIDLGFDKHAFLRFVMRDDSVLDGEWVLDPCRDWAQLHLKGARLLTITSQMTGNRELRIFEVKCTHHGKGPTVPISSEPKLGFLVPSEIRQVRQQSSDPLPSKVFRLQTIFPKSFSGKDFVNQRYVDTSDRHKPEHGFRVFTYVSDNGPPPYSVHVVIGIHESKAWTDVVVSDWKSKTSASTVTSKQIWEYYIDSGSRAKYRLQNQTQVTLQRPQGVVVPAWGFLLPTFTANVRERSHLQLGSHLLSITYSLQHSPLL